jgi:hypothetical protein
LNVTHQLLAYADNVNLLGDKIHTINKTETLIHANNEVSIEINVKKTKYVGVSSPELMSKCLYIGKNRSFENVS